MATGPSHHSRADAQPPPVGRLRGKNTVILVPLTGLSRTGSSLLFGVLPLAVAARGAALSYKTAPLESAAALG